MELPGNLKETTLAEIIQIVELSGKSGRLQIIRTDVDERASIYFLKGEVFHAQTQRSQGIDALMEMFSWNKGKVLFSEASAIPPRTITKPNAELIVEGMNEATKMSEFMMGLPPLGTVLKLNTTSATGDENDKLMLDANEWNFLILVDGTRTLKQIFDESNLTYTQAALLINKLLEQKVIVPVR